MPAVIEIRDKQESEMSKHELFAVFILYYQKHEWNSMTPEEQDVLGVRVVVELDKRLDEGEL